MSDEVETSNEKDFCVSCELYTYLTVEQTCSKCYFLEHEPKAQDYYEDWKDND